MPTGRISKWMTDRGFGFIVDDRDQDARNGAFVHIKSMPGHVAPEIGDRYEFDIVQGLDGREKAGNLRPLTAAREEADRVFGS